MKKQFLVALGAIFLMAGVVLAASTPLSGAIPQEWLLYSNYSDSARTQITSPVTLTATVVFPDDGRPTRLTSLGFVVLEADGTAIRCTDPSWSGLNAQMTRDGEFFGSFSPECNGLSTVFNVPSHPTNPIYDYQDAPGHTYVFTMTIATTPPAGETWYVHADIGGTNPIGVCAVNPGNCLYQDALQRPSSAVIAGGTTDVAPVTAAFSWTSDANRVVRFTANATTDPNYNIARYVWDFGDGTPVLTQTVGGNFGTPAHIYGADGTYTVGLTVFDDSPISETRKASTSADVNVVKGVPTPEPVPSPVEETLTGQPASARYLTAGLFGVGTALLVLGASNRRILSVVLGGAVAILWMLWSVGAFL